MSSKSSAEFFTDLEDFDEGADENIVHDVASGEHDASSEDPLRDHS